MTRKDLPKYDRKIVQPYANYQNEVNNIIRYTWEEMKKKYPTLTLKQVNMIFTSEWRLVEELIRRFDLYDETTWEVIKLPALGKFYVSKGKVRKLRQQIENKKEREENERNV